MKVVIIILCLVWYIVSVIIKKNIKADKNKSENLDPSEEKTFSSKDSEEDMDDEKDIYSEGDIDDEYVYDDEEVDDEYAYDDEEVDESFGTPVGKATATAAAKSTVGSVAEPAVKTFDTSFAATDRKSGVVKAYNIDVEDDMSAEMDINTDVVDENIKSAIDFSDVDKARAAFVASEIFNRKYN